MSLREDPHKLARELLGRELSELEPEEQRVLERIGSGTLIGMDADEIAQAKAGWGDRMADRVAAIGGSWGFILGFALVLLAWVLVNSPAIEALGLRPFDRYPFIFLNLVLSMLAAVQAPIIMMSQNRQANKDRVAARHDYEVNLRTQLEIIRLSRQLDRLARELGHVENEVREE